MGAGCGSRCGLDDLSHQFIGKAVVRIAEIFLGQSERLQERAGRNAEFAEQIGHHGDRCNTNFAFMW
jgi:hypothetical protein